MKSDFEKTGADAPPPQMPETGPESRRAAEIARLEEDRRKTLLEVDKRQKEEAGRLGLQPAPAPTFVITGRDAASQNSVARAHFEKWRNVRDAVERRFNRHIEKVRDPAKFNEGEARENSGDVTARPSRANEKPGRLSQVFAIQSRGNDHGHER